MFTHSENEAEGNVVDKLDARVFNHVTFNKTSLSRLRQKQNCYQMVIIHGVQLGLPVQTTTTSRFLYTKVIDCNAKITGSFL